MDWNAVGKDRDLTRNTVGHIRFAKHSIGTKRKLESIKGFRTTGVARFAIGDGSKNLIRAISFGSSDYTKRSENRKKKNSTHFQRMYERGNPLMGPAGIPTISIG